MREDMTQDRRLDYLVEEFKADSGEYRDLKTPDDRQEKRRVLRSLMNIRMPKQMSEEELKAVIGEVLFELGPGLHTKKEMGKVMKGVMAKTKGAADGKLVSKLVASVLV